MLRLIVLIGPHNAALIEEWQDRYFADLLARGCVLLDLVHPTPENLLHTLRAWWTRGMDLGIVGAPVTPAQIEEWIARREVIIVSNDPPAIIYRRAYMDGHRPRSDGPERALLKAMLLAPPPTKAKPESSELSSAPRRVIYTH